MVVSGSREWARRVRELRVQFGWSIVSGITAKEMLQAGDFPPDGVDLSAMKPDDCLLLRDEQDRLAAYRWNLADEIRKKPKSARTKMLEFVLQNVGRGRLRAKSYVTYRATGPNGRAG